MPADLLCLDGSFGEGGGQILRTALSLSALTGRPVRLERIRAGREKPGLQAQHLTAVRALADLCAAGLEGGEIGSRSLTFVPACTPQPGNYNWQVGTAGAVTLIWQAVLWPLAGAVGSSQVTLSGGTHTAWSPPADYVQRVYLPWLSDLGLSARLQVESWGWYPRGGGLIRTHIGGEGRLRGLTATERGSLRRVTVLSAASNLPEHVNQRQAQQADFLLRKQGLKPQIELVSPPSAGPGTMVMVLADYQHARAGVTAYGRLGKPAEQVAQEACQAFVRYHKRAQPVDQHLADQLLLPLALAALPSSDKQASQYAVESITRHLLTNAWVIRQFLNVEIDIQGEEGQPGLVKICGLE